MWAAITALAKALAAYYTFKVKNTPPLYIQFHDKADAAEDEQFALLKKPDAYSQHRADQLIPRIVRLRRYANQFANLPTADSPPQGGSSDSNG